MKEETKELIRQQPPEALHQEYPLYRGNKRLVFPYILLIIGLTADGKQRGKQTSKRGVNKQTKRSTNKQKWSKQANKGQQTSKQE